MLHYYGMYPFMYLLIIFIVNFGWCTANLNLALSYGCRRRDFFRGIHLQILIYTLFGFGLNQIMLAIPRLGGWVNDDLILMSLFHFSFPFYALLTAALVLLGCMLGPLYMRSKIIAAVLMVIIMLSGTASVVALMFLSDDPHHTWGILPSILTGVLILVCLISEFLLYRFVHKATVR